MGIHLIEMKVKPLPLGLLVMRIEQVIGVIRSFYQTKVMAGEIVAARLRVWVILLKISRDRAIFQIGRFGVRGFSHHDEEGHDDGNDKE